MRTQSEQFVQPLDRSRDAVPGAEPERIMATCVGLRLPAVVGFETWQEAGRKLVRLASSTTWCLGDWLVYGQERYHDRYQRAVQLVGLDYQTLRNYAWVARKFDIERRRANLSLQHHAEVGSLAPAEQDLWLDRAEAGEWSKSRLRRELRLGRESVKPARELVPPFPWLKVGEDAVARWRAAAENAQADFGDWVVQALDEAAAAHLPEVRTSTARR